MTREKFHEELERTELELLSLGELAGNAVQRAVEAIVEHNDEKAGSVIEGDDAIDELYLKLDSETLQLLALQTPVASDLRLISAILHSSQHLERIGDQAVNVAKLHLIASSLPPTQAIVQELEEMGTLTVQMVRTAMEAFAKRDLELCLKLPKMDDPVDRLNRIVHIESLKLAEDRASLDWGLHMNLAARALERVGDNAVDIAEQAGFLITGEFKEYTDASHGEDLN
jgi:phosphate transport system protein